MHILVSVANKLPSILVLSPRVPKQTNKQTKVAVCHLFDLIQYEKFDGRNQFTNQNKYFPVYIRVGE